MSFVNSPSPDFFHGLGNFENDGMAPAPNCHIYQEEEIPSENYSHEPSASNSDPNMIDAPMMNTATMPLIQHGVTPATNSMNFQETSAMTSIVNMSSPKVIHGGLGNFPPHESVPPETNQYVKEGYILAKGCLMPSGNMNFQGRELESYIGVNNSMPSTSNPVPNMIRAKMSIASTSSHEAISKEQGNYSNQESEGMNDSMRSKGIKRNLEAREKGTEEQCNFQPSLEPKNKKLTLEELGKKNGKEIKKIMTDRLNRQIEQDKKSDMELVHAKQWPLKEDVQVIREECKKIAKTYDLNAIEAKQKLLGEAKNLEITQKAREDFGNPSTNMDHIVNHLGLYFDRRFIEAIMKKLSADLGNGCSASSLPLPSAFNDLKNQVYVQGNKQVEPEDFQGLLEELKKLRWGEIPSYLQPIANRIVKDFAKVEFRHTTTLVLFCAAVKEMEDFPAEKLGLDTLKKWGATLKKAKEVGFQVGFADDLLNKNLLAYFALTQILGGG